MIVTKLIIAIGLEEADILIDEKYGMVIWVVLVVINIIRKHINNNMIW